MTCMTLTLLGNYAQTGHFGGPLAYTPYNVAAHLAGPELGGLRYDYRRPKHPYRDKFIPAAGKAAFWNVVGAPMGTPKIIAFEGDFVMTEAPTTELKTLAITVHVTPH